MTFSAIAVMVQDSLSRGHAFGDGTFEQDILTSRSSRSTKRDCSAPANKMIKSEIHFKSAISEHIRADLAVRNRLNPNTFNKL